MSESYKGRFQYAGGHPDVLSVGGALIVTEARVDGDGLVFGKRTKGFEEIFRIPTGEIKSARYEQPHSFGAGGGDHHVVIEMERDGRVYEVRLKPTGMRRQKDAYELYGALSALRAGAASS